MVIPVGQRYQQTLYLFTKQDGQLQRQELRPTLFVPMTGEAEQRRQQQPDARKPTISNGSFEQAGQGELPFDSWYYQRQVVQAADSEAPLGSLVAEFRNETAGRMSSLLQGFAVDGRYVAQLDVSAWVRYEDVKRGTTVDMMPAVVVSFYDENRAPLEQRWLGPWRGSAPWHKESATIRVPIRTREAILRLGLFGATGAFAVDAVQVQAAAAGS